MSFGYLGDTSTKIKQQVKNQGVISIAEAYELEKQGFLGGSLKLLSSQTVSGVSAVNFTSIEGSGFDVHKLVINNFSMDSDNNNVKFCVRYSNDGGSSYENPSSYQQSFQFVQTDGTTGDIRETSATEINNFMFSTDIGAQLNAEVYFYNLNNSAKYSMMTSQATSICETSNKSTIFGGGVYGVAETVNAIAIFPDTGTNFSGTAKLFGIKQ